MSKQRSLTPTLLFLVAAVVCSSLTAASGLGGGMVGGRTKVKDVKTNQEVQDLGRYSVQQFNRVQKGKKNGGYVGDLRFQEVVEAETQVVSGVKYYLKIAAVTPAGVPKTFDAVVVVKPWAHSKELLNFDPSPPTQ
ncbi:cysteine proteinase inhibitor B [Rhododendron vialii]|uniref:cysteine proteinase inhibitor B n=1 Tax=Rhododendron vialii TaxID=182163 RepID=UPI00265E0951|nr:cysteine proteinase inhibitor B [Rhododendron vialii]